MSYVILWLLWEKFSLSPPSLAFSFFSPSQTTDLFGYFRWDNAACLLLISVRRCRHFLKSAHEKESEEQREREKAGSIYNRQWKKERKRKNIIVTANPIISLMYVCVDWHVKVFFSTDIHTYANRTNQQPKKMLSEKKTRRYRSLLCLQEKQQKQVDEQLQVTRQTNADNLTLVWACFVDFWPIQPVTFKSSLFTAERGK